MTDEDDCSVADMVVDGAVDLSATFVVDVDASTAFIIVNTATTTVASKTSLRLKVCMAAYRHSELAVAFH